MKNSNEYEQRLGRIYAECPKAVLAAIAVSALTSGGDWLEQAQQRVADEWLALANAGIVQPLIGEAKRIAKEPFADEDKAEGVTA